MKILFYDMGSYTYHDFLYYLKKAGHTCKTVYYHFPDKFHDDFFCERFTEYLTKETYDVVISVNFFPLVAQLCNQHHVRYIAWCYDSPLEERLADYFHYETNYIFLFDRVEAAQYQAAGYTQVFHLPLAVNTDRLDGLTFHASQIALHSADVSFVGNLYDSPLETLLYAADGFTKGYVEGILQAQLRIYGCYLLDDLVTEELLCAVNSSFEKIGQTGLTLNHRGLVYAIATEITHLERSFLLEQCGELFKTHFYTSKSCNLNNVRLCGPVKYEDEMPCVFRYSKLNLCPTLKCIQSGIPLRALDIMGAGGALLANYQPELAEYFEDGKELILYGSMEEAIAKADYYLKHDELRKQIARNGYQKVKKEFSYPKRIEELFRVVQNNR
ncbi:MAG: glycosyltransferase [Lachnospiraceae bacterium]|nr:glycosyltransferase [Lachnospiraceae bacterium]